VAGELPVRAGWALWGKEPGSRIDYSVLACSPEPFSKSDFGTIITRFAAGTPDTRSTGPGELPWVTMSWVGVDASLHLGICITDKTGQVDGVGRPITQSSYFCLPYREIAPAGVTYSALYDAVAQVRLVPEDDGLIPLTVPVTTTAEAAQRVEDLGDKIVSGAAALLLRGPVSVVETEGSTLRQRLEFIDAVASLLPYGFRAKFSAATWADSGTRHRLRLAFANRPREDAAVVPWRHLGEVPGGDNVASAYFEQLRQLRSGGAAHGRKFDLATVVSHLAARVEPQKFEHPQEALAILREIDLPDRVLRAVRDGAPVDVTELRHVIRLGPLAQMLPDAREALLTALSRLGSAEDWPALRPWLGQVQDLRILCRILTQFGRRVLWTAQPDDGVLRECLDVAADRGLDDDVLAELVGRPEQAAGQPGGVSCAAGLLARMVLADGSGGEAYRATRDTLAGAPLAAAGYLAALASSGRGAGEFLTWLTPHAPPDLIRPFGIALGLSHAEITERDVGQLAEMGTDGVRALLAAGSCTKRLGQLLPGFTRWLAARGELPPADRRYWSEHLRVLAVGTAGLRAWLDMALLTIGAAPTALPPAAGPPDSAAYVADLTAIWKRLDRDYSLFSGERCVRALARYLQGQEWTGRKAQAAAVADLTGRLLAYDREHVLAGTVGSALAATPAAKRWDFARDWLARVRQDDPDAVRSGLLTAIETAEPGTGPGQLAGLCLRAHREGITADQAYRKLAKSGAIDSAGVAVSTLTALRQEFEQPGGEPANASEWRTLLVRRLVLGAFGDAVGQDFRELMSRTVRHEIDVQITLLAALVEGDRDGQYEITDEERDDLAQVKETVEAINKKSRKRPSLWRRAGNGGQPAQESG
jgi:hypothetical protein